MSKTYKEKNISYSLRMAISLSIPNVNNQKYRINSLNFRGSVSRNSLSIKFKKCKFLQEFKLLEFWLPVVLFFNFNISVKFFSMYLYVNISNSLVGFY